MFDLEGAIGQWRERLSWRDAFTKADLDEMESHLRDEVASLVSAGFSEQKAFYQTVNSFDEDMKLAWRFNQANWEQVMLKRARYAPMLIGNYFKVAVRNLLKQKVYSAINICGLAIGIACSLLIFLYVQDELSYDAYHEKADRIHRVVFEWQFDNDPSQYVPTTSGLLRPALLNDVPGIEQATRIIPVKWHPGALYMESGQNGFWEEDGYYADPNIFEVFSFPLQSGFSETALKDPFTMVLTEGMALKYFGKENPIGKTLTVQDTLTLTVTGILEPIPSNSHFTFDFLISMETNKQAGFYPHKDWGGFGYFTYILLEPAASLETIKAQVRDITRKYIGELEDQRGFYFKHFLQPLTRIHLHTDMAWDISDTTPVRYIYIFSSIVVLILLIACINFMNLATARSITRTKEVGMRKVVGAYRKQLVLQFLGEAWLTTALAVCIALGLIEFILPMFNNWIGKDLQLFANPAVIFGLIGLILCVGLIAGSYPSFVLSKFQPIDVLKGVLKLSAKGVRIRQGLVVFQFVVSIALMVGTIVVYNQLGYMKHQNLGFDQEQIVVIHLRSNSGAGLTDLQERYALLKSGFSNIPNVVHTSVSWTVPGKPLSEFTFSYESTSGTESKTLSSQGIDHDFVETYGLTVLAGRNFSKDIATDHTEAMMLNEQALAYLSLGSPEETVGKTIKMGKREFQVIGVVKDFHHDGLHNTIRPLVMRIRPHRVTYLSVKIRPQDVSRTLTQLETVWKKMILDRPFEFFFLDKNYDKQYRSEEKIGQIFSVFSALAILIACLGLLGLISFTAQQRIKEIGIRKVMGASVANIILLLSKDFLKLVVLANLIAWPIAYYAMDLWLQDFAYRTTLGIGVFALSGLVALLIALMTVGYQALKAARSNPVDVLRYE